MNPSPTGTAIASPLLALIDHIARLTGERQRPRLEAVLVEALRDLTNARRIAYYKLQQTPDETLFWLAVETDALGTRVIDDGINLPANLASVETRPEILPVLAGQVLHAVPTPDGTCLIRPVAGPGSAAGFIELDAPKKSGAQEILIVDALVTAFHNVMDLLDYSEADSLTGLLNRKTFDEHLMHILASLTAGDDRQLHTNRLPKRRRGATETVGHWLGVIDIDHFKRINDNFGHLIGDEVLLMVANLMKTSFRFRDKLFRFGGEEFVVVLKPTGAKQAGAIFERFRSAMENHLFPQVGQVTISIGYAQIRLHDQPSVILDHADQTLYWSKEHGRNQVSSYEALIDSGDLAPAVEITSDIELF